MRSRLIGIHNPHGDRCDKCSASAVGIRMYGSRQVALCKHHAQLTGEDQRKVVLSQYGGRDETRTTIGLGVVKA